MNRQVQQLSERKGLPVQWRLRALLLVALVWAGPTLACGSFAPRPTPTPTLTPPPQETPAAGEPNVQSVATPAPPVMTDTPTPEPTPTFTPTPEPGTALVSGAPARVTAPAGLNLRQEPSTGSQLVIQLGTGVLVTISEGPVDADGFTWWRVDDGQGNAGWAADGDGETEWLSPRLGEAQPANRPPRVGDRAVVTAPQLTIRALPGVDAPVSARANEGQQFTVFAGPQSANGYTWYQSRSDDGAIEGWAADGDGTDRWLSPLE
jgi:hypothetical protein